MNNESYKINYQSLVLAPLLTLNRPINSEELREYRIKLAQVFANKNKRIDFELNENAKNFFELTHYFWIETRLLENDIREYSLKDIDDNTKLNLKREIDPNIINELTDKETLTIFNQNKLLRKNK